MTRNLAAFCLLGLCSSGCSSGWWPPTRWSTAAQPVTKAAVPAEPSSGSEAVRLAGVEFGVGADSGTDTAALGQVAQSIVARVDDEVILAEELFGPIRPRLLEAKQKLTPDQFRQVRDSLISQQLRNLIERKVVVQAARRALPERMLKALEAHADIEFQKKVKEEMEKAGVGTEAEFRRKLAENGQSLDQMRDFDRETFVAQQFLGMQLAPRLSVSRQDLLDYYEKHQDEFRQRGGVRWSEILVSSDKHGSRQAASEVAWRLVEQLRGGGDFSELAKRESAGATASQGGAWDVTTQGSYIVAAVDKAIFSIPAGAISDPIEGPKGWHIVRVDEIIPDKVEGFEQVQEKISSTVRQQRFQEETQRLMQELLKQSHIVTVFDKE